MKTEYKFIHFEQHDTAGQPWWWCLNNKSKAHLGTAAYYKTWKLHVFYEVDEDAALSADCLRDVAHFLDQLDGKVTV